MSQEWLDSIPETDKEIYRQAGFGNDVGFGASPALLIIDVQYRTSGSERVEIAEAIKEYPTACGTYAWSAIDQMQSVLASARDAEVPLIYPCVAPKGARDLGRFGDINPKVGSIGERGYEFVSEIAPKHGDLVLSKRHASAFFGTALVSYLIDFQVDTVIVMGCTTSGCVRATVADAFSLNFRTIVVEDAVYDRSQISHAVSLFDMNGKYADVVSGNIATNYLHQLKGKESRNASA